MRKITSNKIRFVSFLLCLIFSGCTIGAKAVGANQTQMISGKNSQVVEEKKEKTMPANEYCLDNNIEGTKKYSTSSKMNIKSLSNGTVNNISWSISDDVLTITGNGEMPDFDSDSAPWQDESVSKVVISEGITSIGKKSFVSMNTLESVSFPESLTKIGEAAFYGCGNLIKVELPNGVKTINSGAFANCYRMKQFVGNGITHFGDYVFQSTAMESFEIPSGVSEISSIMFYGNDTLEKCTVAEGNTTFTEDNGIIYSKDKKILYWYPSCKEGNSFSIPDSVTKIGDYAFYNTAYLKSVDFSNVKVIGEGAFYCSGLDGKLVLSDNITEVGYFAFQNSNKITSVKFGKNLKESSYSMFEDCAGITSIDFGGLSMLGMRTFLNCAGLKEVKIPDSMKEWGGSVFNQCENLEKFTANGLESVAYADFANCTSLKTVNLTKVKKIYREAFTGCSSLKAITLPATTQWVDANAFEASVDVKCLNGKLKKFGRNGLHYAETITIEGNKDYKKAFEVLSLVNKERKANGLSELVMDKSLLETAMIRAGEQAVLFSHTRPDGSSCFTANAKMIAENVAIGQTTASSVMNSWMNSQGHRENIMLNSAKTIGIGCFYINGSYMWVQCFGQNSITDVATIQDNKTVKQSMDIPRDKFSEAATTSGTIWGEQDEYTYKVSVEANDAQTKVQMFIINPGFSYFKVPIDGNITWKSSNNSVASVDKTGKVHFSKKGSVTITGQSLYYKGSVKLNHNKAGSIGKKSQKITTAKINKIKASAVKKKTVKISLKTKASGKGKITYKVKKYPKSMKKYISISKKGVVTFKKKAKRGTYKIEITAAAKGNYKKTTKIVTIKVK